jgi:hypothetical protein
MESRGDNAANSVLTVMLWLNRMMTYLVMFSSPPKYCVQLAVLKQAIFLNDGLR